MNDASREEWIRNDEGLYRWWKSTRLSMRDFIRQNREELTTIISAALNSKPGGSYLHAMGRASDTYHNTMMGLIRGR
jgi:hypothetical protein